VSARLLVVAGEVSGDQRAGAVIRAMRDLRPDIEVFGIGGDELARAGAQLYHHVRDMAVFGPFAALVRFAFFRRVFHQMRDLAMLRRPDAALLVDYGGFNLRLAAELKKQGIKVLYYISPQVWASRRGRIKTMASVADRLMVIFPFELDVYRETSLHVDYVGHPLVDEAAAARCAPLAQLPWAGSPRVAVLPGSRAQEIERILPPMLEAGRLIELELPGVAFLVAAPDDAIADLIRDLAAPMRHRPTRWHVVTGLTREVLRQADAAMVASGTATLESALMNCPMVVAYKTSPLLYGLARLLIRIPFIGMVNLIAGRLICPELIQGDATGRALARECLRLLREEHRRLVQRDGFMEVQRALGEGGATRRVAEIIDQEL
jgi:lipid-A-disaccharide synthase